MIKCVEQKGGMNKYNFVCEVCGDEYELKISQNAATAIKIECDKCGAKYRQSENVGDKPMLILQSTD